MKKEEEEEDYLLLKCCKRQCTLLSLTWTKSLTTKIQLQNATCLMCFGLKLLVIGGLNNFIFSIGFQYCQKSSAFKWL